jgi:hypothetical protein
MLSETSKYLRTIQRYNTEDRLFPADVGPVEDYTTMLEVANIAFSASWAVAPCQSVCCTPRLNTPCQLSTPAQFYRLWLTY